MALFAERVRSADARFVLNGDTGPAVARLVGYALQVAEEAAEGLDTHGLR